MCRETFYADENRVFFNAWDSVDSESESESDEDMNVLNILDEPDKPDESPQVQLPDNDDDENRNSQNVGFNVGFLRRVWDQLSRNDDMILSVLDESDEEDWNFSHSELSHLADPTADRQRHNWPRIPNTWPGYRTAFDLGYGFYKTFYKRRLPNFDAAYSNVQSARPQIECHWALTIVRVMVVWYVFYKVAKQTTPQLKKQFYEGVSKQQIVDFMILGGMDFNSQCIENGFQTLLANGHIYSTNDDFHFNLTDAGY
jgi:hypothetical protein